MSEPELDSAQGASAFHRRARWILTSFLFTFMAARITVFLIASRRIPDIYLHFGGTHVHHMNYGILLLSGVGAYLLLGSPRENILDACRVLRPSGRLYVDNTDLESETGWVSFANGVATIHDFERPSFLPMP